MLVVLLEVRTRPAPSLGILLEDSRLRIPNVHVPVIPLSQSRPALTRQTLKPDTPNGVEPPDVLVLDLLAKFVGRLVLVPSYPLLDEPAHGVPFQLADVLVLHDPLSKVHIKLLGLLDTHIRSSRLGEGRRRHCLS